MFRSYKDVSFKSDDKAINNKNTGYLCDLCGQGPWSSELDVDIHRKTEHKWDLIKALKDENIAMCSICLRVQDDKESLVEHVLVNHFCCPPKALMINREIYICDYCNRLFFNKQLLITHIFHWHTKKTPENASARHNCPKCWKNIRAKSTWFHLLYHGAYNVATCPICLKTCENQLDLLQHLKTHPYTFQCNICNYQTTKECYLNNHLSRHKKPIEYVSTDDASRFFLPEQMAPSLNNRMTHIFKGIPLVNEVRICILCRALVFSVEEMDQHIFVAHVPDEKEKSKVHQCNCGEEFFNSVLLKHHIFKMKGNHAVWDGVSPISNTESDNGEDDIVNVYQIYGMNEPLPLGMSEIIITGISNHNSNEDNDACSDSLHITDYEEMEA